MRERVLAVVGAIALVAVALLLRSALTGDDGADGGPNGTGGDDLPVVACTPELQAVCEALADEGEITLAKDTLDLAEASDPPTDIDGWITWDPAPQIAGFASTQGKAAAVWRDVEVMGAAPLGALTGPASVEALDDACGEVTWSCLTTDAATTYGLGTGSATTSEGLMRLAPLASALSAGGDYRETDDGQLRRVVRSVANQDRASAVAMAERRVVRRGNQMIVVGPTPMLDEQARTEQGEAAGLVVLEPTPEATAAVVVATRAGRDLGEVDGWCEDEQVADALEAQGVEPCEGTADGSLAGFLFQIQKKVS